MVAIGSDRPIVVYIDVVGTGADLRQIDIDVVEVVGSIIDIDHRLGVSNRCGPRHNHAMTSPGLARRQ